jgi:glucan phosphoethanolaminetransferase (alkaline phosphatase superfamily)
VGPAEPEAPSLRWLWRLIMLLILILSATIAYALSDYYTPYLPKAVKTFLQPAPEPPPPPK